MRTGSKGRVPTWTVAGESGGVTGKRWSGGVVELIFHQRLCRGPLPYAIRYSDLDMVARMRYLVQQITNFPTNLLNEKDRYHVSSLCQV